METVLVVVVVVVLVLGVAQVQVGQGPAPSKRPSHAPVSHMWTVLWRVALPRCSHQARGERIEMFIPEKHKHFWIRICCGLRKCKNVCVTPPVEYQIAKEEHQFQR